MAPLDAMAIRTAPTRHFPSVTSTSCS